jgi:hypothetical protein
MTRNHNSAILSKALVPSETVVFLERYVLWKRSKLKVIANDSDRLNGIQEEIISD